MDTISCDHLTDPRLLRPLPDVKGPWAGERVRARFAAGRSANAVVRGLTLVVIGLLYAAGTPLLKAEAGGAEETRPNILWITAEDMSPTLGCYGDTYATTPNIDRLAQQATKFTHAFATTPVCSPARACLINGLIATTQGTHPMRSRFPIPEFMSGFPAFLRNEGYYTSNNVKTDYNSANEETIIARSWDQNSETADWSGSGDGQPFFSVINLMTSHQSRTMVWPYEQFVSEIQSRLTEEEIHDPAEAPVPPYYPDTPVVRKTIARYYDCVTAMDKQVGEILERLEADGLADDTIVFFYSDHGSGMPRHKRVLLDSGIRVPLLIRFPEKFRQLAPTKTGGESDRLVSFEDFGPTVLSLAGVAMPEYMEGIPFLGAAAGEPREYVFGHRDRIDEVIDKARSVRTGRYLYVRNYMPHLGYNQQSNWVDDAELQHEFYRLADADSATAAQRHFVSDRRPVEELYDCQADPLNLNNLADSGEHQAIKAELRSTLQEYCLESRDLGFAPELDHWQRALRGIKPYDWGQSDAYRLGPILELAAQVGARESAYFATALGDDDSAIRYWAALGCLASTDEPSPAPVVEALRAVLDDPSPSVQIVAATALLQTVDSAAGLNHLVELLSHTEAPVVLHAARAIELSGDPAAEQAMRELAARFKDEPGDMAWFIRFSTDGYLSRL